MFKNFSQLHVQVNSKDFFLNAQCDSTFPEVKEALFQFQKSIGAIEDQLKAQQELADAEKNAAEVPEVNLDDKPPEVVD